MPTKKKKFNARFPPARIKKIMQTDDDVGKVAAPVPVIISKALEMFMQTLVEKACSYTQARNAKTLTTAHVKKCISSDQQFDFLKDLVEKIPDLPDEEEYIDGESKPKRRKVPSANKEKEPRRKRKTKKEEQLALSDDSDAEQEEEPESDEETSLSSSSHTNTTSNSTNMPSVSTNNLPSTSVSTPPIAPCITVTKPGTTDTNSIEGPPTTQSFNHIPMMNSSKSIDDEDDDYDS